MRLDKLMSNLGYGSRKDVKKIINSGQVTVNGQIIKKPNYHIDPDQDEVMWGGEILKYEEYLYYLLHKPAGVISATEDFHHETVLDCLDPEDFRADLFPVGRLDIDTTGLLLLTNNGQLAHRLTSPKHEVSKIYQARVDGPVTEEIIHKFTQGIELSDFTAKPARLWLEEYDEKTGESIAKVEVSEGKYHQVKRMFGACDLEVLQLHRLSMGPLLLDNELAEGSYRQLTQAEEKALEPFGFK